ncbi:putative (sorB) Cytochrome c [Marinobacter nauticus ATCC 49840]|uniref:SorU family sulfite dehydrogenase c-type cytochrome subunit n=1 Tax=Marinobacter nauticus TaxID=2743 RepID=UPI000256ECAB|nr:cytochrome c [Marinobacter nauticus]CCG96692.1 putative (sorB) Cytochrome c [Marinobacter nauticus ATCC 49840]
MKRQPQTLMAASLTLALQTAHADNESGRAIFTEVAQPSCTICHTLADAGASGSIGPNLDGLRPNRDQVIRAVTSGVGVMPAFEESLTESQIQAVADYVVSVTSAK